MAAAVGGAGGTGGGGGSSTELREELVQDESNFGNHLAVRESLQIALHASFVRCGQCWLLFVMSLVLGAVFLTAWSETIYEHHANAHDCDQPLAPMLRALYIIGLVNIFHKDIIRCFLCYNMARDGPTEPLRVTLFRRITCLATTTWPFAAAWMLSISTNCNSELKSTVLTILIYYLVAIGVVIVLPAIFISVMLCLVRRGLVRSPLSEAAAPEGFVDELPVVPYDAALFDDSVSGGYSSTCPICLEGFDAELPITRTPCGTGHGHAFHTPCLRGWLRCSRTCPLCRVDLTDPAEIAASGREMSGHSMDSDAAVAIV